MLQLYVWDSQSLALTYTNSVIAAFPISISANGQKLAYYSTLVGNLMVADLVSNTVSTVFIGGVFGSRPGLQFSDDGRFLAYAVATRVTTNPIVSIFTMQQPGTTGLLAKPSHRLGTRTRLRFSWHQSGRAFCRLPQFGLGSCSAGLQWRRGPVPL